MSGAALIVISGLFQYDYEDFIKEAKGEIKILEFEILNDLTQNIISTRKAYFDLPESTESLLCKSPDNFWESPVDLLDWVTDWCADCERCIVVSIVEISLCEEAKRIWIGYLRLHQRRFARRFGRNDTFK